MTKRKSSLGDPGESTPWTNYEEAREVEASLLKALKLLQGNGLGSGAGEPRGPLVEMVSMSLKLAQAYLADEGQKRGARRLRSSGTSEIEELHKRVNEAPSEESVPARPSLCLSKLGVLDWHARDFLPRQTSLPPDLGDPSWTIQEQFTGVTAHISYSNGRLTEASIVTDGQHTDNITKLCQCDTRCIPQILVSPQTTATVIGTFTIPLKTYQAYINKSRQKDMPVVHTHLAAFVHAILSKDPETELAGMREELIFCPMIVAFQDSINGNPTSHLRAQAWLEQQGFFILLCRRVFSSFKEAVDEAADTMVTRSKAPYEISGSLLVVDNFAAQQHLGFCEDESPAFAVLWQYPPLEEITRLNGINWQVGGDGMLEPFAVLEPVTLGGLTYEIVGLGDIKHVLQLDLKVPDCVVVRRSTDRPPQIVKAVPDLRVGTEVSWQATAVCPVCHSLLEDCDEQGTVELHCSNLQCPSQPARLVRHFAKVCIRDTSSATWLEVLQEKGLVRHIGDLFQISQNDLEKQGGLTKRTAKVVSDAVAAAKAVPLDILLQGLGIRHMDCLAAKNLSACFGSLNALKRASIDELQAVEGVRHELAQSIQEWFQMPGTAGLISSLTTAGIQAMKHKRGSGRRPSGNQRLRQSRGAAADQENEPVNTQTDQHALIGKCVAMAGKLDWSGKSREEFRALVEGAGAKFCAAITSKTDIIVIGSSAERSRVELAEKHKVSIIQEETFFTTWLNTMDID